MEGAPLSLILDVVILVLLGLTIVYAARLSLQLRRLRDSKSELDKVVRDLVKNLDRADRTVMGLKVAAAESGTELQGSIDRARAIADELELMTDSGDRLASRLEALVDNTKPLTAKAMGAAPAAEPKLSQPIKPQAPDSGTAYAKHLRKLDEGEAVSSPKSPFVIRDPEAERGIDPASERLALEDDGSGQGLYSEAERDLFRAMKNRTKGTVG